MLIRFVVDRGLGSIFFFNMQYYENTGYVYFVFIISGAKLAKKAAEDVFRNISVNNNNFYSTSTKGL